MIIKAAHSLKNYTMTNIINKIIRRQNIKWLIKHHQKECLALSQAALKDNSRTAIESAYRLRQPHNEEIKRLLKELETL
jgi:hypothetical protein